MFFYFLCALLLHNAFACAPGAPQKCTDNVNGTRAGNRFCEYMVMSKTPEGQPLCTAKGYDEVAKQYCARSCGYCDKDHVGNVTKVKA